MDAPTRAACVELLERAPACYLTTLDVAGRPYTRAVFNLRNRAQFPEFAEIFRGHDEDFLLLLGTNASSRKITHLRSNPLVSAYFCLPAEFHGLMLSGAAEILDSPELRHRLWLDSWTRYYPQGPDDPDYAVVRLLPDLVQGWWGSRRFEHSVATPDPRPVV